MWRVCDWLTWPLQVRELKRAGFRRTGWMKWEAGPVSSEVRERVTALLVDMGGQLIADTKARQPIPADLAARVMPWDDPQHDVLADIREAMKLAEQLPPRPELHCALDVVSALLDLPAPAYDPPLGIDVIADGDMPLGRWELREGGTVIDSGRLELGAMTTEQEGRIVRSGRLKEPKQ